LKYCSGNGQCIGYNLCKCNNNSMWSGVSCDKPLCLNDCSNKGVCSKPNKCTCAPGYSGDDCSITSSCLNLNNCTQNGVCINEACICYTGFTG
jgi:hypothetical protein